MRKLASIIAVSVLFIGTNFSAQAQDLNQDVNIVVPAVSYLNVSGDPGIMTFSTITGVNFDDVTENSTTYDFAHNAVAAQKITATLDAAFATGIGLTINLTAPAGGTSTGPTALLVATAVNVVTAIPAVAEAGMSIEYVASAPADQAASDETNTVTFTIAAN
jgi:hypothetical protein